ncbi:MAG: molybdopterin molybdotransferase MoeA [Halobacteriales archaeon]
MPDHPDLIPRADAVESVLASRIRAQEHRSTEAVSLDAIGGRVAAEPIVAEHDQPPRSHATMDGYAVDASDPYPLEVVETEVFPEDDAPNMGAGTAVPVATGAPVPDNATAVLKREDVTVEDGQLDGPDVADGTYVYEQGSNVAAGETLVEAGERLGPKDAILLRDIGHESVTVYEPFTAGVLATGTEIHEGRTLDLDSPMLSGLVRAWGHEATYEGTVPDEADRVENRIRKLAEAYDVVITTGGTSVGHKDHVISALQALGDLQFHRVSVRPGKPIALAELPAHDAVAFAIPGKPIGAYTVATAVMRPFFNGDASLPSEPATLARDIGLGVSGFEYFVPVTLENGEAMPLGHVDSPLQVYDATFDPSVLSSSSRATRADGFFVTEAAVSAGETVQVVPYAVVE